MYKILISGYYGFNNIGDESILRTVIDNLREKLGDVDITVLSHNPQQTSAKYRVKAAERMSFRDIWKSIRQCDLLISGGGSLLQDATSKRSILYYLFILHLAQVMGKKTFIYSQGIGPISSGLNRRLTALVLKRVDGIVVRDTASKDLLVSIGIPAQNICVTADPVIRVKKADLALGMDILQREGAPIKGGVLTVGWAIKSRHSDRVFYEEVAKSIRWLKQEYQAESILIPFYHSEDLSVCNAIADLLDGDAFCLQQKYLSEETLSIIGCMDVLVGVRLHSLIYSAVMNVPMIGLSYDPKVNSFLSSINQEALCDIKDFTLEKFQAAFRSTMEQRDSIQKEIKSALPHLVAKLDQNEELIRSIMK